MTENEVLVLGGGLAGLATAACLGARATVLERAGRPGGLVRSFERDGWWFDHVLHLLHFKDDATKTRVLQMLDGVLSPCPPEAHVVTAAGVVRFPLQEHLGQLDLETAIACLDELACRAHGPAETEAPRHYRELLLRSFGPRLCDLFFFPYNSKMWRRDLSDLAPTGFIWNLARPDLQAALRGALRPAGPLRAYNSDGWYPRPAAGAPLRGMEVLAQAVAAGVHDLRLHHEVMAVHPKHRAVTVRTAEGVTRCAWQTQCVSTLPLPALVARCDDVPAVVAQAARSLPHNRVVSVAVRVQGPRPALGLWRYYPSPEVCFTRLVFMHAFDPLMAPPEGWPLLVEVPLRSNEPVPPDLAERVVREARQVGALGPQHQVLDATLLHADPAYVVFTRDAAAAVDLVTQWLREQGVTTVGRYGRWEYSSMAQVLRDGHAVGAALAAGPARAT